ncbi:endo-beta-N-acetylglucosaminidase [Brachybacterium sp. FME24]|uniref:EndoS/ChiA family endoglycosidase n=1 Tax=Brachybacterium sp. FME24 TaxID=2742605 RepID=UPI001868B247|nr:endo-beta-N-acetylglucosaminidase [Brachybacterium sp. FME24]
MPGHAQSPGASAATALGELAPPLEFAYFRTWHDRAVDPSRPNSIGEIPPEIDLVFVFPDYTPDDSPFWGILRDEYVPTLHDRGTRAVRTTDIRAVLDPAFPDTPQGHRDNAEHLVETLVDAHGLDGLDIDMERSLDGAETARAVGVFQELSRLIGPQSGTDRLFIYDTNRDGTVPLFRATAECFDFVLVQSYGRAVSSLHGTWDTFAPHIDSEQYLIGFSFYEENDNWNEWNDTSEPFEESRAVAFADWQPEGAVKGGVFSYAVDRDGVAFKDDTISQTNYEWSKALKHRMLERA